MKNFVRRMMLAVILMGMLIISGCATTGDGFSMEMSRQPMSLPDGGYVDVIRDGFDEAIIGIRGVEVDRVEIYGERSIYYPDLVRQGEWFTFVLERGNRFNFVFRHPKDGKGHFARFSRESREVPPKWMGPGITPTADYGQGSSLTARSFLRR